MDNVTALKNLYASLGGNPEDVADVTQISELIDASATYLEAHPIPAPVKAPFFAKWDSVAGKFKCTPEELLEAFSDALTTGRDVYYSPGGLDSGLLPFQLTGIAAYYMSEPSDPGTGYQYKLTKISVLNGTIYKQEWAYEATPVT